jgi:serine/threonine protein kinase
MNGDLRSYCLKERPHLSFTDMLSFCAQISRGMSYLEGKKTNCYNYFLLERGIIHGHLSPKCCLLTENKQVKISSTRSSNHHAQLRYSAPEAIVLVSSFNIYFKCLFRIYGQNLILIPSE